MNSDISGVSYYEVAELTLSECGCYANVGSHYVRYVWMRPRLYSYFSH